jgi:hypothetical protein
MAGNAINIPSDFVFYAKLKIEDSMFNIEDEQEILTIEDDSENLYTVKFDTRVYIKPEVGKTQINSNYLSFKLYKNEEHIQTINDIVLWYSALKKPNQFEYMIGNTENNQGVYMIEKSINDQSVNNLNIANTDLKDGNEYLI